MTVIVNGTERALAAETTIAQLLEELELTDGGVAVAVNDAVVVRSAHTTHRIGEGDRVEIIHAVAGG